MNKKTLFRAAAVCAMAALIPACGGGGVGGGGGGSLANFVDYLIAGPGGQAILTGGGDGANGAGGPGGSVLISGTAGSDVRVLQKGAIDASFDVPAGTPDLGDNPLVVSTAVTVTYTGVNGVNTVAQDGMFFGQDGTSAATGLWIQPGGTLTLPPNNAATPAASSGIHLIFPRGIRNEGTLKVAVRGDVPADAAALRLDCVGFYSEGVLSTMSADPAGGGGGNLRIFSVTGSLVNKGTIDSRGTGTTGAGGGHVDLGFGDIGGLYNTASITTSGAANSAGMGGAAGDITLINATLAGLGTGPINNSGALVARGGAGNGGGGSGGVILLDATLGWGPVCNSAVLDSRGGDAGTTGTGGPGRSISLQSSGYLCRCAGQLVTRGGSGGTTGGSGGDSGDITITQTLLDPFGPVPGRGNNLGVWVGASLSTSGGACLGAGPLSNGGNGGKVKILNSADGAVVPGNSPIVVAGLSIITTTGGNGLLVAPGNSGGSAGDVTIETNAAADPNGILWLGRVVNEAVIHAIGGAGPGGNAGSGGVVNIRSVGTAPGVFPATEFLTSNTGEIDTTGGTGAIAGNGGAITITDRSVVFNSGDLTASAGGSPPTGSDGGDGGDIQIVTSPVVFDDVGSALNTGTFYSRGGNGANGGVGGSVTIYNHFQTTNQGSMDLTGGSGTNGGSGGKVFIYSDVDVRNTAVFLTTGGAATTGTGGNGNSVYILGQSVTHSGNIVAFGNVSSLGIGGDGGIIRIEGTLDPAKVHGILYVYGGSGAVAKGATGSVLINGVPVPLTNGTVTK